MGITEEEIQEYVLGKLELKKGLEITGDELWNQLVDTGNYQYLGDFLGFKAGTSLWGKLKMEEELVAREEVINAITGSDLSKLTNNQRNDLFASYKISHCRLEQWTRTYKGVGYQKIKVFGIKKNPKGVWGKKEICLFVYMPQVIKKHKY